MLRHERIYVTGAVKYGRKISDRHDGRISSAISAAAGEIKILFVPDHGQLAGCGGFGAGHVSQSREKFGELCGEVGAQNLGANRNKFFERPIYNNIATKDVIGVVTHPFNFAADPSYVYRFSQRKEFL